MYQSKYYTCEEIDERLLKGYYDDAVSKGYTGTFEQLQLELASVDLIDLNLLNSNAGYTLTEAVAKMDELSPVHPPIVRFRYTDKTYNKLRTLTYDSTKSALLTKVIDISTYTLTLSEFNGDIFKSLLLEIGHIGFEGSMYITHSETICGKVSIFGDTMGHVVNQEVLTNCVLSADRTSLESSNNHTTKIFKYERFFNLSNSSFQDMDGNIVPSHDNSLWYISTPVMAERVVGNPAGDWDKGTAEAYIDKEIAKVKNWVSNTPVTDVVVVETLPASGKKNTLYRVKGTNAYSEYGWDGSKFVLLAVKEYGIDEEPVAGSENLVKSGGVLKDVGNSYLSLPKNVDIWEESEVGCLHDDGNNYDLHADFVTTDFLSLKKGDILVAGVGIVLPSNNVYRSLIIYDLEKQLLQSLLFDDETITYKATQDVLVRVSFYADAPADELFLYYGKPGNITRERKEIFPKVGNLIDLESPEAIKDHGIDTQGNIVYYKDMIVAPSIPVIDGNLYTVSMDIKKTIAVIYEDERKNKTDFILITESPKLIEIPTGVKYVRLIGWSTLTGYVYFGPYYSERSETALANNQLSPYIPASAIEGADSRNMLMFNSPNNLMKYSLDFDGEISPWDAGYVSHPIPVKVGNMIPYYGATENKGITETGEIASYEGGIISKRFKIEGGKSYTFYADYFNTTQVAIRFEDDEGNKVGFELIQRKVTHTFTAPEEATYCIVPVKIHSHPQGYVGMSLSDTVDWCGLHQYVYYEGDKTPHVIRLEDENHNILSVKILSSSERALSISPFAGCKYIRIGTPSQSAQFKEVGCYDLYPLRGKKIALYGDSITVDYYSEMYAAMMKYRTQASDVQRFGLSGGDYTAHLQQDTYLNPLLNYNPDVVIIHSVNSHRSSRPVGTMSSAEGASDDIGALKKIFRKIIEKNNKVKIYFCLPLCYGEVSLGDATWVGSTSSNSLGLYLSDYIKGYMDVCRNYGVEIINLTDRCGFKDLVESGNNREYTYDGVHPIWKGYNIMTGIIAEHINNMWNQRND